MVLGPVPAVPGLTVLQTAKPICVIAPESGHE
jgi:hypothetical protein